MNRVANRIGLDDPKEPVQVCVTGQSHLNIRLEGVEGGLGDGFGFVGGLTAGEWSIVWGGYRPRGDWAGPRSFVGVESLRTIEGHASTDRRDCLGDLGGVPAMTMLHCVRGHWGIENQLHGSRDVTFREDALRNRVGDSAEDSSRMRRLARNLLLRDKTCHAGLKGKRLQACLNQEYLLTILGQGV